MTERLYSVMPFGACPVRYCFGVEINTDLGPAIAGDWYSLDNGHCVRGASFLRSECQEVTDPILRATALHWHGANACPAILETEVPPKPPALNLPGVILDSIRVLLTNTPSQVCKHWAALTLLDQLERAGVAPDVVLVKALCAATQFRL